MSAVTCADDRGYRKSRPGMTNPYLQPVSSAWSRVAGIILLVAALV